MWEDPKSRPPFKKRQTWYHVKLSAFLKTEAVRIWIHGVYHIFYQSLGCELTIIGNLSLEWRVKKWDRESMRLTITEILYDSKHLYVCVCLKLANFACITMFKHAYMCVSLFMIYLCVHICHLTKKFIKYTKESKTWWNKWSCFNFQPWVNFFLLWSKLYFKRAPS